MIEPHLGEIQWVAFTFAPRGWAFCHGQLLPIRQYSALFSLLGVTYGGDGVTTFALPDLRGRVAVGATPQSASYALGRTGGSPSHTLTAGEVPAHSHTYAVTDHRGTSGVPGQAFASGERAYVPEGQASVAPAGASAVGPVGSSQPHQNTQPSLGLHAIIATEGTYPYFE